MNKFQADLLITDYDGKPVAVIEVDGGATLPIDDAIYERRSLLTYGLPTHIPYFLLLSQDDGYLWKGPDQFDPDAPPTYHFPMESVMSRYSPVWPRRRLFRTELELVLLDWLVHLIGGNQEITEEEEPEKTLALAGFSDSIKYTIALIEEDL